VTVDTGQRSVAVAVLDVAGRPVAVTGRDEVTLWDLTDGTRVGVLERTGGRGAAEIVSWSVGEQMIAVLDFDGGIAVWDVGTGRRRPFSLRPAVAPGRIAAVAAADGRPLMAVGDGQAVSLWMSMLTRRLEHRW
jgi:hypothetical protein